MIASIAHGEFSEKIVPRKSVCDKDLLLESKVKIFIYREKKQMLKKLVFETLPGFMPSIYNLDLLWKMSWYFQKPIPDWNGCMQLIHDKQSSSKYPKDTIVFLPIINLDPSDMSCILSTITFLADLAEKHSLPPIITFDQPLYWKSNKIIAECTDSTLQKVILLLGCFHTVMNILGCAGYLMEGSGLNDILVINLL